MKNRIVLLLVSSSFILHSAFSQGTLTPPGAPAPTMKSLTQIEPRTPISTVPYTIATPGSYYLTGNFSVTNDNAIVIATNGVRLDLNGFTLSATTYRPAGCGILITGAIYNVTILNGYIQGAVSNSAGNYNGPGFASGISYSTTNPVNTHVYDIAVIGCSIYGINLGNGDSTVVESCTVRTVGSHGIIASTVKSSVAVDCGIDGIVADQASDSRGEANSVGLAATVAQNCFGSGATGEGLHAGTAQNCAGLSTSGSGLVATHAQNCYGYGGSLGYGMFATISAQNCFGNNATGTGLSAPLAQNCYGTSTSDYGLRATMALNCYGGSSTGYGLSATTAQNCYGYSSSGSGSGSGVYATDSANNCSGYAYGSGYGVYAGGVATGCRGNSATGIGVYAFIANVCHGTTSSGTALSTFHNVNSF